MKLHAAAILVKRLSESSDLLKDSDGEDEILRLGV